MAVILNLYKLVVCHYHIHTRYFNPDDFDRLHVFLASLVSYDT